MRRAAFTLLMVLLGLCLSSCQSFYGGRNTVVLDIGHFVGSGGAATPSAVNGQRISEVEFWYRYSYYVKRTIERAGYKCIVTNRGKAPNSPQMRAWARRAGVVQLNRPDIWPQPRYASSVSPDRVSGGMISADYAAKRRAACSVYLHHNSTGGGWTSHSPSSLLIYNKNNGKLLARDIAYALERTLLNKKRGIDNRGRKVSLLARYVDADRGAGWMNTCDDAGVPAVIIESCYLNNKQHAQFLSQAQNARKYAQAIGLGIVRYMRIHSPQQKRIYRANKSRPDKGSFGYAAESRELTPPAGARLLYK